MTVRLLGLDDLPSALSDRFDAGDGLIWTGAGVSRRSIERRENEDVLVGVPSGSKLQRHLHNRTIGRRQTPETLAEIAGVYVAQHGRDRLNRLIRKIFGAERATSPVFYDIIAALPSAVRVFVTTNYDPFLERALGYRNPVIVTRDEGLERITQTRPVIYKPHGDAQHPEGCVIATADYDAWEQSTGSLPAQLAALYLQHTVVAIGYRAQDDNFRRLLRNVNTNIVTSGGTPHTMYVVSPDADPNLFHAYAGAEYDLVLVRTTGEDFLRWLIARLNDLRHVREADALSRLIDPPHVRAAWEEVQSTRPPTKAAPAPPLADLRWVNHAEALERLSREQIDAGRQSEGLLSSAQASRAFRLGGDSTRADRVYRRVLRYSVEQRQDVALAGRLLQTMRPHGAVTSEVPEDDESKMLVALVEVLSGIPHAPPEFISVLETRLASGPPVGELDAISYRLERLRAEHAVTAGDFARAAETFARATVFAPGEDQRSYCAIRSAFFAGWQQDAVVQAASLDRLRHISIVGEAEASRQRAIGWLSTLHGDLEGANSAFEQAAALAVYMLDAVAAAAAFRGSAWVGSQRPVLLQQPENAGRAAYRLEQTVASASAAPRATVHGVLAEAENELRRERWREAWLAAMRARRLAYTDLDPSGAERAEACIAVAWLRMIPNANDEFSLASASRFVALARPAISEENAEDWVGSLRTSLLASNEETLRARIICDLSEFPVSRRERVGSLLVLGDLGDLIDGSLFAAHVVPALLAGLECGWSPNSATDSASAACRLLEKKYELLTSNDAKRILSVITRLRAATPRSRLDQYYPALAQAIAMAPPPPAGGASLAAELLSDLDDARRGPHLPSFLAALHVALAATADRGDAATRRMVISALEREAAAGNWDGFAVLVQRGIPIPENISENYLREMTARVRALTVDTPATSFGPVFGDFAPLTKHAAERASCETRDDAIRAATDLLDNDCQWGARRAQWVDFLTLLVCASSERITKALPSLLRAGRGNFAEPGILPPITRSHPLSSVQINLGSGANLRARALVAIGSLLPSVSATVREELQDALLQALNDPEIAVREGAVIGIQDAARGLPEAWHLTALVRASRDHHEKVRALALHALNSMAREMAPISAPTT